MLTVMHRIVLVRVSNDQRQDCRSLMGGIVDFGRRNWGFVVAEDSMTLRETVCFPNGRQVEEWCVAWM